MGEPRFGIKKLTNEFTHLIMYYFNSTLVNSGSGGGEKTYTYSAFGGYVG